MKKSRLALLALAVLWMAFAYYVSFTASELPEQVATHFAINGEPNGWMSRDGHVQFTLLFGTLLPAFIVGLFAWVRSRGEWGLNIPHKALWLAPERREATFAFVQRQGFWFAGMFIVFFAAIHHAMIVANARSPVRLPTQEAAWLAGFFLLALAVWIAAFIGRFFRRPA